MQRQDIDCIIGLNFLNRIPTERLFQLFVDGDLHACENGAAGFEKREPNCMQGFYNGLAVAVQNLGKKLDIDLILKFYTAANQNVTGRFRVENREYFRNKGMLSFAVPKERCTPRGVLELCLREKNRKNQFLFPPQLKTNQCPDLIMMSTSFITIITNNIFQESKDEIFLYKPPCENVKEIVPHVEEIIETYHKESHVASDDKNKKILAMVRCTKALELLHPFGDGNGRTFVNIMLNFLLMQNGFPPATFYQPNVFDLYADDELVDVVKDAMLHTIFTIETRLPLFNFDVNNISEKEKAINLNQTRELKQAIFTALQTNITADAFNHHLKSMKDFLVTVWNGRFRFHQACAIGDVETIDKFISEDALREFAPNYMTPLYKGLLPLGIACRMNQVAVASKLITYDKSIVNSRDVEWSTPLHHAVTTGNADLARKLLDAGASLKIEDNECLTPSELAAKFGSPELIIMLTINDSTHTNWLHVLIMAIKGNNIKVLNWLLFTKRFSKEQIRNNSHRKQLFLHALYCSHEEAFLFLWNIYVESGHADYQQVEALLNLILRLSKEVINRVCATIDWSTKLKPFRFSFFKTLLTEHRYDDCFFEIPSI